MNLTDPMRLRRLRWGIRAVLALGLLASVAANVLHADPNPVSQAIAAWSPLALLLTVELISRVPVYRRVLSVIRLAAAAAIAAIAAYVSYFHMVAVAQRYGEDGAAAYLLPLSVDGLVVVGSVSLVELAGRIRTAKTSGDPAARSAAVPVNVSSATSLAASTAAVPPQPQQQTGSASVPTAPPADASAREAFLNIGSAEHDDDSEVTAATPEATVRPPQDGSLEAAVLDAASDPLPGPLLEVASTADGGQVDEPPTDTAGAVAYWRRRDPTLAVIDIAKKIGKHERTVRRNWTSASAGAAMAGLTTGGPEHERS